jgi:5'-methylthioadenosine phosphorylase
MLYAARALGVHYVLNWDTGVAINPVLQRGDNVIAVDFIDWTRHQPHRFGSEIPADLAVERRQRPPMFCPHMVNTLFQVLPETVGAVYLGVDGPRRETPAEARLFRQWGADVCGQNLVPEVYLAQELGICYAGLVTLGDRSADQLGPSPHGEMRAGMGQIIRALPDYVNLLGALPTCDCEHG